VGLTLRLAERALDALDTVATIERMNTNYIKWLAGLVIAALGLWTVIQDGRRRGYI